jgi:HAD superfamily hydrolase (TIGR01509 family)
VIVSGSSNAVSDAAALDHIALVIFDCDGVLIDSEPIASRTLAEALSDAGVAITALEAHRRFTGNAERDIRRMCAHDYGLADVDGVFAAWHERLYAEFKTTLTPMPGIADVVTGLERPICVASNSTMERLRNSLGQLSLWQRFWPFVFSAEAVSRPKPAPDLLLHCATELAVAPRRCVMIDDSPHGISAAVAAGMVPIGFVDPADPRPGRRALLKASGAFMVATGAVELQAALLAAGRALALRSEKSGAMK